MDQAAPPLRPADQRWLIETKIASAGAPNWTRLAVLAPTSKAAVLRAGEALGAKLDVQRTFRDCDASLDEEAELLAKLGSENPVTWATPVWSDVRQVPLSPELLVSVTPPPADEARGIDVLPAGLLAAHETDRIYTILDGAAVFGLVEQLEGSGLPWKCLFQGEAARDHASVAPYLIELVPGNSLARKLLRPVGNVSMPGRPAAITSGIFLSSPVSLDGIWRHLRKFTMLSDPAQDKRLYFRFYDPLIFRTLVVNLAPDDLATFCTGIRAIAAVNAAGDFTVIERRQEAV